MLKHINEVSEEQVLKMIEDKSVSETMFSDIVDDDYRHGLNCDISHMSIAFRRVLCNAKLAYKITGDKEKQEVYEKIEYLAFKTLHNETNTEED